MKQRLLHYRPPRIAMLFLLLAATLHWLTPLGAMQVMPSATIAVILGGSGFLVMMWAWWQFKQEEVAICPTAHTERLLTDGIYSLTRNPMYLGIVMMLAGIAVWIGTIPFVLVPIAYFAIINAAFCPYEEAKLEAAFGDDYRRYQARTRRWI